MIFYFLLGLIISLFLVIALTRLLIVLLRNNWNHNNQRWFSYLFPVVIAVLIAWTTITQLYPRLIDSVHLINGNYELSEAVLAEEDIRFNHIQIEGVSYYHLPLFYSWPVGERLQIMSLPNLNYIVRYTAVEEAVSEENPTP